MIRDAQSVPTWFSCLFSALWGLLVAWAAWDDERCTICAHLILLLVLCFMGIVGCLSGLRWREMHTLCPLDSLACSVALWELWVAWAAWYDERCTICAHLILLLVPLLYVEIVGCLRWREMHNLCPLDSPACFCCACDDCFVSCLFVVQWYWRCCLSLSLPATDSKRNPDRQQTYRLNKRLKAQAEFGAAQANLSCPTSTTSWCRHHLCEERCSYRRWISTAMAAWLLLTMSLGNCFVLLVSSPSFHLILRPFKNTTILCSTVYRHGLSRNIVRRNKAANMILPERKKWSDVCDWFSFSFIFFWCECWCVGVAFWCILIVVYWFPLFWARSLLFEQLSFQAQAFDPCWSTDYPIFFLELNASVPIDFDPWISLVLEGTRKKRIEAYSPSFAGPDLFTLPNSFTFGSNMVFTRDEFVNGAHIDEDCTGLACGFYFMIHRETGHLYSCDSTKSPVEICNDIHGVSRIWLLAIKLAQQDVGLEMT